jgi:hypothetical protein
VRRYFIADMDHRASGVIQPSNPECWSERETTCMREGNIVHAIDDKTPSNTLGIGHPGTKDRLMPYVLSDCSKEDTTWLIPLLDAVANAASLLAAGKPPVFMLRVALLTRSAAGYRTSAWHAPRHRAVRVPRPPASTGKSPSASSGTW